MLCKRSIHKGTRRSGCKTFNKSYSYSESESCSVVSNCLRPHGLHSPWNSPGQNAAGGSLSLLQWIFPTQGSNPGLPHCGWILYQLSHEKATPKYLIIHLQSTQHSSGSFSFHSSQFPSHHFYWLFHVFLPGFC